VPGKVTRGTVVVINLDPPPPGQTPVGHEISKLRPCVVIQNDIGNKNSSVVIVAALGDAERFSRPLPVWVLVKKGEGGTDKACYVLCNQVHSVDEKRFVKILGKLDDKTMEDVDKALKISLGLK
jgi:mRNA interferase MazF